MEIKLPKDFKEFLKLLKTHDVSYLLIGGYAVAFHGYPRATNDMHIWIAIDNTNAERLCDALHDFGYAQADVIPDLFLKPHAIIRLGIPPIRIEIVTTISGVTFEECYVSRVVSCVDGIEIDFINLEHLKVNKKASGRHKDMDDLEHL